MTDASVVIVTYGQWGLTEQCLHSLERALGDRLGREWEIVVVDNNSPDETPQRLREWSDRIRLELRPDNLNFAGGCNLGAELATGRTVIFLNNDTVVPPCALEALADQTREPGVAAAGCRLLFPDGTIQHAGVAFYRNPRLGTAMPQHVFHHQAGEIPATQAVFETDSVTAACIAVRRDAFFEVGGFDTGYVNGLEDIDLCLKLRVAGHRIVYRGDITIIHHEGASRGRGRELYASEQRLATMAANDRLFVGRWSDMLEQDDELAVEVWDANLRDGQLIRDAGLACEVIVLGQPSGIGPGSEEARAFIVALDALGFQPAAVDLPNPNVVARLSGTVAWRTARALRTPPSPEVPAVWIPAGRSDAFHHPDGAVAPESGMFVRLGTPDSALSLDLGPTVLAASRAVRDELIARGLERERVVSMPSPLQPRPAGAGGGGLLALLPTHDRALTALLLERLRTLPPSCPIRVLPTAFDRRLADVVCERLPAAELLEPCGDEDVFADLAAQADVTLAADLSDCFDRRALVAASVGTPTLGLRTDGALFDILGDEAVVAPEAVAERVAGCLQSAGERERLRQTVLAACAGEVLRELL